MRLIFLFFIMVFSLQAQNAQIVEKFTDPKACSQCHNSQYSMWKTSVHALSHEKNNELFAKSARLVSIDSFQTYEQTLVGCSNCHNPRLDVKNVSSNYVLAKTFELNTKETEYVDSSLKVKHIQNGISCYICHNVDSIKPREDDSQIGYQNFNWVNGDIIVGPFDDDHQRGKEFHLSYKRDFFKDNNDLCLSCHQGKGGKSKYSIYNTGNELASAGSTELCADCHMGKEGREIISPNIEPDNAVFRKTRPHLFSSVRNNPNILSNAFDFKINQIDNKTAKMSVINKIAHNMPSGFSGRSLELNIVFYDKSSKVLGEKKLSFEKTYRSKTGFATLSYSAEMMDRDTTLKPNESREFEIVFPKGTKTIKAKLDYYLIQPELQKRLLVQDQSFTKPYPIFERELQIK
ncbi:ammonia-forming cytochrome c nitrite reductase subunit c552 [Campylobacter ureolyticus]|uniref:multiheme c-type cytochrome n=1 Tax=Campylobacter ureolyticus TaxID=827 RepID=UPI0022B5B6A0|nr:multiheme c-type cytochrome [Campylobacter ureolyticus]MCZ6150171.1 ammonia-forming cytochrome c nitrite reductase subunit c552 [Campylobacter ureolyticus]